MKNQFKSLEGFDLRTWLIDHLNWLKGTYQINEFNKSPQGKHAKREAEKKEKA